MITPQLQAAADALIEAGIKAIYISLPIGDDSDKEMKAKAYRLAELIGDMGFIPLNPHEIALSVKNRKAQPNYANFMAQDLWIMCDQADAVMLVDGWLGSPGCKVEAYTAKTCGKIIIDEEFRQREKFKTLKVKFELDSI